MSTAGTATGNLKCRVPGTQSATGVAGKAGLKTIIAGGVAGAFDCCITMPMDTMSTQMQLKGYATPMECTRAIVKANGVMGLYAGFVPFLLQSSAKSSIRFFSFELISGAIDSQLGLTGQLRSDNAAVWALVAGVGAGTIESLSLTAPTDRLKVMKQALSAESGGKAISASALIRERGIATLYTGAVATTIRQSTSVAVRFSCYASVKEMICGGFGYTPKEAPFWASFLAGGCGGALSVCLNNPIDVVKSKIQAGYEGGIIQCLKDVVKERGLVGFTAGLSARVPRLFLSQAIQFSLVDMIKGQLAFLD